MMPSSKQGKAFLIMPTLYLVATPIGNLDDITSRAIQILNDVNYIAAEDTRVTKKLTNKYDIHTPLISYHDHTSDKKLREIIDLLLEGNNIALVTDAGTPGISDPGYEIVRECIKANIDIVPIPGASATICALIVSGLPCDKFIFDGFPPRKTSEQKSYFESIKNEKRTVCIYESPTRLIKTLENLHAVLGERQISVSRELTKLHEETFRGTVGNVISHYRNNPPRGEIAVIIEGAKNVEYDTYDARKMLFELIKSGMSERDAIKETAKQTNLPKREIYAMALELKQK